MNNHLIQSQKMLLTVNSQQDWEKVQAEIGIFCKTRLPNIFNNIFDEFASDQTIRIDQLNIDLGDVSLGNLIQSIEEQIVINFYGYFRSQNFAEMNTDLVLDVEVNSFIDVLRKQQKSLKDSKEILQDTAIHFSAYECLAFYCQTGLKPWWLSAEVTFKPAEILLDIYLSDQSLFSGFVAAIKQHSESYSRLIQLISKPLFFYRYHHFKTDVQILKYLESNIKADLFNVMLEYWLANVVTNVQQPAIDNFGPWLFSFMQYKPAFKPALVAAIELSMVRLQLDKENSLLRQLNKLLATIVNSKGLIQKKTNTIQVIKKTIPVKQNKVPENASMLIENAGLIILYPYFKNLFNVLKLLNGNQFIDEFCRNKAIVYLHFLVYNEMPEDESRLVFNKILCGAEPEAVIALNEISFTEEELGESVALKNVLIQHWTKLGSTSIEGLTQTFLIRNGSLIYRDGSYNLHVERKGFDVLLDTIPWSLSIIRLPWNNYLINLNW
ncbi:contractile injection system tape measure protein [Pedobacter sp. GSP4]|uniref:contractile injection system tape measure protein n=1 Tax=Pedobacter sp. GSP4 TaxID=3453716 RepID=UPI003EEF528C